MTEKILARASGQAFVRAGQEIEARPAWKPMHLQPVFADNPSVGGDVSEELFDRGLCLPSGSAMTDADVHRVVEALQTVLG